MKKIVKAAWRQSPDDRSEPNVICREEKDAELLRCPNFISNLIIPIGKTSKIRSGSF